MRTIFDVDGEAHVHISLDQYGHLVRNPTPWNGARCELLIVDCIDWDKDTRREGDAITINGSADAVRKMLVDALRLLDVNEQLAKEHSAKVFARYRTCPRCGAFADALPEWHGDGKGRGCYGLAAERLALVSAEVAEHEQRQAASDARHAGTQAVTLQGEGA